MLSISFVSDISPRIALEKNKVARMRQLLHALEA